MVTTVSGSDNFDTNVVLFPDVEQHNIWADLVNLDTFGINASLGVSSAVDNAEGTFSLNFTKEFADSNFCVVTGLSQKQVSSSPRISSHLTDNGLSDSSVKIRTRNAAGTLVDNKHNSITIFGIY